MLISFNRWEIELAYKLAKHSDSIHQTKNNIISEKVSSIIIYENSAININHVSSHGFFKITLLERFVITLRVIMIEFLSSSTYENPGEGRGLRVHLF